MESNEALPAGGAGVLVFGADMVMGSKIRGAIAGCGLTVCPARALEQVEAAVGRGGLRAAVVDLNMQSADPFEAVKILRERAPEVSVIAYYSHVDGELKERAQVMGVKEILPRSALIKKLGDLLSR
jgi:DNA-binding NtrC family response regulator